MTKAEEKATPDAEEDENQHDAVLVLSTQIEPPLIVAIDGEDFDLLTMEHLAMDKEVKLRRLIAQEERLTEQFEHIPPEQEEQLEKMAVRLQEIRVNTIVMMTTIPESKVRSLPTFAQQKLVELVGGR